MFKRKSINLHFECKPTKFETVLIYASILVPFIAVFMFVFGKLDNFFIAFASFLIPFIVGFIILFKHNRIDKDLETNITTSEDLNDEEEPVKLYEVKELDNKEK